MNRAALAVLPLTAAACPAHAAFAPPLDVAITCTIEETRDDGSTAHRFRSERSVVVRRAGDGFVAELTVRREPGAAGSAALLDRALRTLAQAPLRFRLDAAGQVVAVEDIDAIWSRLVAGMTAMAGDGAGAAATTALLARNLGAMPQTQRQAMLASMLTPFLAPADAARAPDEDRAITLPAQGAMGGAASLPGRETTRALPDGAIEITTRAAGPAGTAAMPDLAIAILRARTIDRHSGVVLRTSEQTVTTATIAGVARRFVTRRTTASSAAVF